MAEVSGAVRRGARRQALRTWIIGVAKSRLDDAGLLDFMETMDRSDDSVKDMRELCGVNTPDDMKTYADIYVRHLGQSGVDHKEAVERVSYILHIDGL